MTIIITYDGNAQNIDIYYYKDNAQRRLLAIILRIL